MFRFVRRLFGRKPNGIRIIHSYVSNNGDDYYVNTALTDGINTRYNVTRIGSFPNGSLVRPEVDRPTIPYQKVRRI